MRKARFRFPPSIGWFLAGALAVTGCATEGTQGGETGSVSMNIDLGGIPPASQNETINTVQWVIAALPSRTAVAQGVINVSQPGSTASFVHFGLVPGAYGVRLTASSEEQGRDGPRTKCIGEAGPFIVNADTETVGSMLINCSSDRDLGTLRTNGEFNRCAIVKVANVSPSVVSVGFLIDVSATGQDDEGDAIDYLWSDGAGTFADPTAATTTYTCAAQGVHEITISVSDDAAQAATANSPVPAFTSCKDSWTTTVECVAAPNCGNGMIDVPEECDPPDVPANWICDPATCLRVPTCGDGVVDPDEDCDTVTPDAFCDASCMFIDPCSPNLCDDNDSCTDNNCAADLGDNSAVCTYPDRIDGALCDDFAPGAGACIGGTCQPIPDSITDQVSNVCVNSLLTTQLSYLPYTLTAAPLGPVVNGNEVDFTFTGIALVPASTLNTGIYAVPGLTSAQIDVIAATVAVRSGATGTTPTLNAAETLPVVKDIMINMSVSECNAAYPEGQNGHDPPCVTEPIALPLNEQPGTLTPTAGAGGEILLGWAETDGAGNTASDYPVSPGITFNTPVGPTAIRVRIPPGCVPPACIIVAWECVMGECAESGSGGPGDFACGDGVAAGDVGGPLLDSQLISIPISP